MDPAVKKYLDEKFEALAVINAKNKEDLQKEIRDNFARLSSQIQKVDKRVDVMETDIYDLHKTSEAHEETIDDLKEATEKLSNQVLELDAYSRRENLRFYGIPEDPNGEPDTEAVLRTFLERDLKMINVENIEFQRVHRSGAGNLRTRKPNDKPRAILARFLRYDDVRDIRSAAYSRPKGSKGSVQEDLPYEWVMERKKYWEQIQKAKGDKKKVRWTTKNFLFIDGRQIN